MTRERTKRRQNYLSEPEKSNLYLITGMVIGILLGLVISWVVLPVKFVDTAPSSLRSDFKDDLRLLIADAFYATKNLPRAEARLTLLEESDNINALTNQAQAFIAEGDPANKAFVLAYLVDAIKQSTNSIFDISNQANSTSVDSISENGGGGLNATQSSTLSIESVFTPLSRPSATPQSTNLDSFILKSSKVICDSPKTSLLLMVDVYDTTGQPIPGLELVITWSTGEEHFFTGFQPEVGLGYADFLMTSNTVYGFRVESGDFSISNFSAPNCSLKNGKILWGGLRLVLQQP